jgi:hypothetical protein
MPDPQVLISTFGKIVFKNLTILPTKFIGFDTSYIILNQNA